MRFAPVVITGIGILSSNGIGKACFDDAVFSGASGIKPITLFDTTEFKVKTAGEISNFRPEEFLGAKGLRTLDRSTKLIASATKLALDDARLEINEENNRQIGVAIGTTLGSIASISDYDKEALNEGPRYVNPALFPNTVINSPASQVSIKFHIKGFNATISTGYTASLDAINYAADFLRLGRAKIVLAGGVEELCIQTFIGFHKSGCLAGLNGGAEISCPFDGRRNGVILGEGAAVLALERLDSALSRRARIYAEVLGYGRGFDPCGINKFHPQGAGLKKAMRMAVQDAGINTDEVSYISAAASSRVDADAIEADAIKEVFAGDLEHIAVSSVKSMTGECFSASGAIQAASAVSAIEKQLIPPNVNYKEKDRECDLPCIVKQAKPCIVDKVAVNAFGPGGHNSCLVIGRYKGEPA